MATNKNALIRYRTIDKCLQNRNRKWTLTNLIKACSDSLYEYEGKDTLVSKRTVQLDIQTMRSDKLGYNAPIICYDRKYYTYEDENYSITKVPLSQLDLDVLNETMAMLSQFKSFTLFSEMNGIIQKLEDKIYRTSQKKSSIIHMEKNENLKGIENLDILYQAIQKRIVLIISYKSFTARRESNFTFHPYILKEFNNRWFLVGRCDGRESVMTLALDRIMSIDMDLKLKLNQKNFNANKYYKDTIGVTVLSDNDIIDIEFKVDRKNAPYVLTKPFHKSQKKLTEEEDGSIIFQMKVHHNYELERLLLGFGESLTILKPKKLRNRMKNKLRMALANY